MKPFWLTPFPDATPRPDVSIQGNLARPAGALAVRYELRGSMPEVLLPPPARASGRKHNLWEETCLELFVAPQDSASYWEFNLSPSGDWQVYRFSAYRQDRQEETAFTSLPFAVQSRPDSFSLDLELDLGRIIHAGRPIQVGATAVIRDRNSHVTYWALTHCGAQADLHLRPSFTLEL